MNPDDWTGWTVMGQPMRIITKRSGFIFAEYGADNLKPEGYVVFRTDPITLLFRGTGFTPAYDKYIELLSQQVAGKTSHPNLYTNPLPLAGGKASNHTLVKRLGEHIPDFYEETGCPGEGCVRIGTIYNVVQHVNDDHGWTREAIADWLETLDLDLTVHQDKVRESGVKRGHVHYPILDGAPVQGAWIDGAQGVSTEVLDSLPASLPKVEVPPLPAESEPWTPDLAALKETAKKLNEAWGPVVEAAEKMKAVLDDAVDNLAKSPEYQALHDMIEALQHPTKEQS